MNLLRKKAFFRGVSFSKKLLLISIGLMLVFSSLPGIAGQSKLMAQQNNQDPVNLQKDFNYDKLKPTCGTGVLDSGTLLGCVAHIVYFIFYKIPAIFAGIMGNIFDFFAGYSIDSGAYSNKEGVEFGLGRTIQKGWEITRDVANIFFIIILIYTAIATIFNVSSVNYKSIVPAVILNALLINFSLFITKAMIDVSNVGAHIFYNQIVVEDTNGDRRPGIAGYTPISEGIVSGFQPQKIIGNAFGYLINSRDALNFFKQLQTSINSNNSQVGEEAIKEYEQIKKGAITDTYLIRIIQIKNVGHLPDIEKFKRLDEEGLKKLVEELQQNAEEVVENTSGNEYAGKFMMVSIIAGAITFTTGLMFLKVAFVFLGRVVGFYISMIFSPFAFMSRRLPFVGTIEKIGWEKWLGNMTNYMIVAPLFIFFLYIIHKFLSSEFYQQNFVLYGGTFIQTIIQICIPMLIIYGLLMAAKGAAEKYGNEFSDAIQKVASRTAGIGIGLMSGGVAAIGRNTLGRAGKAVAESRLLKRWSGEGNWLQRQTSNRLQGLGRTTSTSTFDARKSDMIKKNVFDKIGDTSDNLLSNTMRLSTKNTEKGYTGSIDRKEKRMYKSMQNFQLTGDAAFAHDAPVRAWDAQYERARNSARLFAQNNNLQFNESTFRQGYEQRVGTRPEDSDSVNLRRTQTYGTRAASGSWLTRTAQSAWQGGAASGVGAAGSIITGTTPGAVAATAIGEAAAERVAEQRVGRNIGRLNSLTSQINTLNQRIAPLRAQASAGTISQQDQQLLQTLENQVSRLEGQRKNLQDKFTQ